MVPAKALCQRCCFQSAASRPATVVFLFYHFGEPRQRRKQRRRCIALSVDRVEHESEPPSRVVATALQHLAERDRELRHGLAALRRQVVRLQRGRHGAHDALVEVPHRDALRGIDAGVAEARRRRIGLVWVRFAESVEKGGSHAGFTRGLGTVDDEISTGNRIGLYVKGLA